MEDSGSDDEDFVSYGTPLPELEDDEVPKKPVPLHEQTVKDSKGRQRFHGAFTGGFSAGFFNTVGSKEGFVPSTFVSRRIKQDGEGGAQQQQPEDFMDEEDLGDFGIAPRKVATTDDFKGDRKDPQKRKARAAGIIPGMDILDDIVTPAHLPIGIKLLRHLGWKEGQGVGPRVRRKKKTKGAERVYGCSLPPTGSASESSEDESHMPENVTFAPKDVNPVKFVGKDNMHGLGYSGINRSSIYGGSSGHFSLFDEEPPTVSVSTGRKGIRGAAFGVGMEEDDDDADIYAVDSMAKYDRVLGGDNNRHHGWTAPSNRGDPQQAIAGINQVLQGFKLSTKKNTKAQVIYPTPQIPRGFKLYHTFDKPAPGWDESEQSQATKQQEYVERVKRKEENKLDAGKRARMLGETPHIKSVFELISKEDQAKIASIRSTKPINVLIDANKLKKRQEDEKNATTEEVKDKDQEPSTSSKQKTPFASLSSVNRPPAEVQKALSALKERTKTEESITMGSTLYKVGTGFKPFAKDESKQQRYEDYLAATKDGKPYVPPADAPLTEWEHQKEAGEFARAAALYRPLSAVMASRFTRAQHDDGTEAEKTAAEDAAKQPERPEKQAADMKMFGKLTREVLEWHPDPLLCKRFNIPNPYPDSTLVGVPRMRRDKFSMFNLLGLPPSAEEQERLAREEEQRQQEQEQAAEARRQKKAAPTIKPLAILGTMDLRPAAQKQEAEPQDQAPKEIGEGDAPKSGVELEEPMSELKEDIEEDKKAEDGNSKPSDGRPSMDIFKAIFADSESSSSDSDDDEDSAQKVENKDPGTIPIETLEQRLSPPTPQPQPQPPLREAKSYGPSLPTPLTPTDHHRNGGEQQTSGQFASGSQHVAMDTSSEDDGGRRPKVQLPKTTSKFAPTESKSKSKVDVGSSIDSGDSKKLKKHKKRDRHKEKRHKNKKKKSSKHKKHKKEKKKKHKKEKKKKKRVSSSSESESSESEWSTESESGDEGCRKEQKPLPSNKEIMQKIAAFW